MRLHTYLTESDKEKMMKVMDILKKECGQFLREKGAGNNRLYRGKYAPKSYNAEGYFFVPHRETERKPVDMPHDKNEAFDRLFNEKFGWHVRKNGVFATPGKSVASVYGTVWEFYPCDGYKYVWNPEIHDLYTLAGRGNTTFLELPGIVDGYIDDKMKDNFHEYKQREMSFYCPHGYYMVDSNIWK